MKKVHKCNTYPVDETGDMHDVKMSILRLKFRITNCNNGLAKCARYFNVKSINLLIL